MASALPPPPSVNESGLYRQARPPERSALDPNAAASGRPVSEAIAAAPNNQDAKSLLDSLLAEQRQLTVVEQFALAHERHEIVAPRYRELIPFSAPSPGQQFAFEVDLDKCSGCKACVTACHSLNGLDDDEAWRDVGQLLSDDWRKPFQQTITTACHHCVDPGCLNGCPVLAYEKDPVTGIVRHLDDQCIGCQYCILKCPYDVPKYSASRGIVRKCDMCSQRLAVGEAPACVQACPNEAIRITLVDQSTLRVEYDRVHTPEEPGRLSSHVPSRWLPSAPDPKMTIPSTRFVSKKPLPEDLIPADAAKEILQPPHWPLVWMLVLTQWSVGAFSFVALSSSSAGARLAVIALASGIVGVAASLFHLGKPLKAWRSFLGLRKSWLSREIVVFGVYLPMAIATTAVVFAIDPRSSPSSSAVARLTLLAITSGIGLLGVFCSGMIYHDTRRAFWRGLRSIGNFFGTTAILGLASTWMADQTLTPPRHWLPIALALVTLLKLAGENCLLRRADLPIADGPSPKAGDFNAWSLARSARLMRGRLGLITRSRFFLGFAGGVILPLTALLPQAPGGLLALFALISCCCGELAARYIFFRAVIPPRMPGSN